MKINRTLICGLHQILLSDNVRGAGKTLGTFKTEQNYIPNHILGNFTPLPPVLTHEYMDNLIDYINSSSEISQLIAVAIIHAQFEMIHPFKDGNGRIGRLLIPLFLYLKREIPFPVFYISRFLSENDDTYKSCLFNISKKQNSDQFISAWKAWLTFFFEGIITESARHIASAEKIIALHKEMIETVNRTDEIAIIDILFQKLTITPKEVIEATSLNRSAVYRTLNMLSEKDFIIRTGSPRKSQYIFKKILSALN